MIGRSLPKTNPFPILYNSEYAVWPAPPVTRTQIGSDMIGKGVETSAPAEWASGSRVTSVLEPTHILVLTGLRSGSSWRGQPPSLGSLFLAFFFGLLHFLGHKFSIFCSQPLFFSVHCSLRVIYWCLCCKTCEIQTLTLVCLGPRFWTLFVWGLSHSVLESIMVFREIEKFGNSRSLGVLFWVPVVEPQQYQCLQEYSFSPFKKKWQIENT